MVSYVDKIAHTGAGKRSKGRRRGIRLELQFDGVVEKFHTKNGPAAGSDQETNFQGFDGGQSAQAVNAQRIKASLLSHGKTIRNQRFSYGFGSSLKELSEHILGSQRKWGEK